MNNLVYKLLFPTSIRQLVTSLERDGVLNGMAVKLAYRYFARQTYWLWGLSLILFLIWLLMDLDSKREFLTLFGSIIIFLIPIYSTRKDLKRYVIPLTSGEAAQGKVLYSHTHTGYGAGGEAWRIDYSYNWNGKKYKEKLVVPYHFWEHDLTEGQTIPVLL